MTKESTPAEPTNSTNAELDLAKQLLAQINTRISKRFIGQDEIVKHVLVSLLSNGHILLEGVPGLGKTLLVKTLAECFDGLYQRIQFTPDLMPADITGHALYDMKEGEFQTRKGPVFTNLLLADEINRAPAKSQAALLEVMQERQVTIDGEPHKVPHPFMVLATQNPIEQEGTYALPEAELDRFLMKVEIDYPSQEHEIALTKQVTANSTDNLSSITPEPALLNSENIHHLQTLTANITLDKAVMDYAVNIVRATRDAHSLTRGAGPRASIALVRCARASAILRGDSWVIPDDIKQLCLPVLRHRVALSPEIEIQGINIDDVLLDIIKNVDAPRV